MDREEIALIEDHAHEGAGESLSPRELEVLDLLAKGLSNKQIARALYVTPHTVKAHMTRILYKLGVSSRTEAAVMWATRANRGAT
jgi:two-component system nitrate/nitrite response regulator NarL